MGGINEYVALDAGEKKRRALVHTPREIAQQPQMWLDTFNRITIHQDTWREWFTALGIKRNQNLHVILSGAGTSYYAAFCQLPYWRQTLRRSCEAWPTTHIVTEPKSIINAEQLLLISLARSGNNPETIGSVRLVEQLASKAYHLAITCNKDSFLGQLEDNMPNAKSLVLHPDTLDKGLAMTSSFTNLVLAGQLLAGLIDEADHSTIVNDLSAMGDQLMKDSSRIMAVVDNNEFDRVFVLGDGSQYGAALEGVLKFEEFSDGAILGLAETFLAARHGYANVINENTLVVFLLASNPYVRQYQMGVVREIAQRRPNTTTMAVTQHEDAHLNENVDHIVVLDKTNQRRLPDFWRAPLDTIVLQCLSLQSAVKLGVPPDNPFRHRATARAIEGLALHPYDEQL